MSLNKGNIIKTRVTKLEINIDMETASSFELKVECRARLNPPKDSNDDTALLIMNVKLQDANDEKIDIECEVYFVFKFDQIPEEYDTDVTEACAPMAQQKAYDIIDKALESIGYPRLDLSKHLLQSE